MSDKTLVRKQPVQKRSRTRVAAILKVATEMISESGSEGLKMNELARKAGIPIGSLYQFFPNKQAIIHTLANQWMERIREQLRDEYSGIQSLEDASQKVVNATWQYYELFVSEPVVRDIWCSTQSDKLLQQMDIEDSRMNGDLLFDALAPFVEEHAHERLSAMCFLFMQLTGSAMRLAITQEDDQAKLLVEQYARLSFLALNDFRRSKG